MNKPFLRAVERTVAGILLLLSAPIIAVAAVWILVRSGGPVLYRSVRVGCGGQPFLMLKLRTMRIRLEREAWARTASPNDPRLLPGGQWIRRRKLDELPQLWNIVQGDMAFVGPRPELPEDVAVYSESDLRTLDVLPGLTDLASIRYFDLASELVASGTPDVDADYHSHVAPERMRLRRQYVDQKSLALDARILFRTIQLVVFGVRSRSRS